MRDLKLKRQYLRSPLNTYFLYEDDEYVFKGKVSNISEGGILLKELPHVPEQDVIPVVLDLPKFPEFSTIPKGSLINLGKESFEHLIIRAKVKIKRSFEYY